MLQVLDVCATYLGEPGIPSKIAYTIAFIVKLIQFAVPILLIIWGMLDLGKAVMAQKEDEIKKGQNTFIKRLIAAIIVFFIVSIVKLVIGLFAGNSDITNCLTAVLNCDDADNCTDPQK